MRDPAILLGLLLLTLAMPGCDRGGEVVRSETQPEAAVPPTTPAPMVSP